jgi:chlorobactene glucosyltransferase
VGTIALALLLLYALIVLLASAAALIGYGMFKPLGRPREGRPHKVSIVVAAKEEADMLRESLASLTKLDYKDKEVIVVYGPSQDGTEQLAQEFAGDMTVIRDPERPPDWLGKSWACHHGYLKSTGDILLFCDADVVHTPESLGVVLANLDSQGIDLLTLWPEIVTRTRSERVIFPATVFFLCTGLATGGAKRTPRGRVINGANGQYIMITREAYDAIGGHEAIKTDIMEDSAIGRSVIGRGLNVVNANGEGFLKVMPYARFAEAREAHERFGAGLIPSWGALVGVCVMSLLYFVGPFALLGAALLTSDETLAIAAAFMSALVLATQAYFSLKVSRAGYFLLAPLSGVVVTAALVAGFVLFRRGGIVWKNVRYASDRFKHL